MQHDGEHITVAGTITGTLFSVAATIDHQDYFKTDDTWPLLGLLRAFWSRLYYDGYGTDLWGLNKA
jgi:hypothetical protein